MWRLLLLLLPVVAWAQDQVNTPAIVFDSAAVTACTARKAVSGSLAYCDDAGVIQTVSGGTAARCGDNLINQDPGKEECDGTALPTECASCGVAGATNECRCVRTPVCGNRVLETGGQYATNEVCDPPSSLGATGCLATETCNATCTGCSVLIPMCGDSNPEGAACGGSPVADCCDPPGEESTCAAGKVCQGDCKSCVECGDGVIDAGEDCDPGDIWGTDGQPPAAMGTCQTTCTLSCTCAASPCGDGIMAGSETCDPPTPGSCSSTCKRICTCGNGLVEEGCDWGGDEGCEFVTTTASFGSAFRVPYAAAPTTDRAYVVFSDDTDSDFQASEAFTIYVKVKPETFVAAAAYQIIAYTGGTAANNNGWALYFERTDDTTGRIVFEYCAGSGACTNTVASTAAGTFAVNTAYELAVTRTVAGVITVNRRNITSSGSWEALAMSGDNTETGALLGDQPFTLGADNDGGSPFFGVLDDVQVWTGNDWSLTEAAAYTDGPEWCAICGSGECLGTVSDGGGGTLELLVLFNEGSGTTVEECTHSVVPAERTVTAGATSTWGWTTAELWGGVSGETESPACAADYDCTRERCECVPETGTGSCGDGVLQAGEQCDTSGATKTCGSCYGQNTATCCDTTTDVCTCDPDPGIDQALTTTLRMSINGVGTYACPPASGTCTDGANDEPCATCVGGATPPATAAISGVDQMTHMNGIPTMRFFAGIGPAAASYGQYMNFGHVNAVETDSWGDAEIRRKFTLGFKACSGDWGYSCSVNSDCTAYNAAWTCATIPRNTSVFLRREDGRYAATNNWSAAACTEGSNDVFTCTGGEELVYDHANEHFIAVVVAHIRQLQHQRFCTGYTAQGQEAPQCTSDAQCSGGTTCQPVPMSNVFFDNVTDPNYAGTGAGGEVPAVTSSAQRLLDPRAGITLTYPSDVVGAAFSAHDSDAWLSRNEYLQDLRYGLVVISKQLADSGIIPVVNIGYPDLLTTSGTRTLIDDYSQNARLPTTMLEFGGNTGSAGVIPPETRSDLNSGLEESLDQGRWLTGGAGVTAITRTSALIVGSPWGMSGGGAGAGARQRELNAALTLLMRGNSGDATGPCAAGTGSCGRRVFPTAYRLNAWAAFPQSVRDWFTSATAGIGIRSLGEPAANSVCVSGITCADDDASATLPLSGLPNCCVYRRNYANGAVLLNTKTAAGSACAPGCATGQACWDGTCYCTAASFNASAVTLSGGNWVYGDVSACPGTDYTFTLNATNMGTGWDTGSLCLLMGDGTRMAGTGGSTQITLRSGQGAIIYKGACP